MFRMDEYNKTLGICQTMLLEIPADARSNIARIHSQKPSDEILSWMETRNGY